jgi:hypothetical protein
MVISADFEKQKQFFDKKKYRTIALLQYLYIVILLVKIARLTRALGPFEAPPPLCGLTHAKMRLTLKNVT